MADCRIYHGTNVKKKELVSIIIPVFNTEKYLDTCLQSITGQTFQNMEILLINDGSADGSGKKCRDWSVKDQRIRYFEKGHSGLGATRNFGIGQAEGEYVMFLDSDDWVAPCFVEHMYKAIRQNDADMAFCDYYKVDGTKKIPFLTKAYTAEVIIGEARNKLIYGTDVAMWIKIYKRNLFLQKDIRIPDGPYEDTATYPLILLACRKVVHLKEKLLYYRINREGSILSFFKNRKFAINALKNICSQMKQRGLFEQYEKEMERYCVRFVSYSLREMEAEKFTQDKERLLLFLYDTFPNVDKPYGKRFLSIGSNDLYCMVNQIPYDLRRTVRCPLDKLSVTYTPGKFDYLAIDFLQDDIKQGYPNEEEIQRITRFLNATDVEGILLIRSRMATAYGEYGGMDEFEQQKQIEEANDIIRQKEALFLRLMTKEVTVIANHDARLLFADVHSRHGCAPYHMNDAYYLEMADEMIRKIREQ